VYPSIFSSTPPSSYKVHISLYREEREHLVEVAASKYVTRLVGEITASEAANIANNTLRL